MDSSGTTVALFFTFGTGLETWVDAGLLNREVAYYKWLATKGNAVLFVTYDTNSELVDALQEQIAPIRVLHNRWKLPAFLYSLLAPILHRRILRRADVFKSNQLRGCWTAPLAGLLLRRRSVVRCGFAGFPRPTSFKTRISASLEGWALRRADLIFVATERDRSYLSEKHRLTPDVFRIVRTPIDTEKFCPTDAARDPGLVITVGRLADQKNIPLLLDAVASASGSRLIIVGEGPLGDELKAQSDPAKVSFLGAVPNAELPGILGKATLFALTSRYEGSPKALLEAMSCGLPVIGTNVPGIAEMIDHGVNGLLCEERVEDVAKAIELLLTDREAALRIGRAARDFVTARYSMEAVAEGEMDVVKELVDG